MERYRRQFRFLLGGLVVVLLTSFIVGTFIYMGQVGKRETALKEAAKTVAPPDNPAIENTNPDAEHRYGDPNAKVIISVFGDYQCPYTIRGVDYLKTVVMQYNSGVAFIYHHFPLESIHANARYAAQAAEAASLQGKFWPMSSLIFAGQDVWSGQNHETLATTFEGYAETLGLDINKYKQDIAAANVRTKIDKDISQARERGLNGTPSVFLNGEAVDLEIVYDSEAFNKLIGAKLE
ncbi:MAG: DsbA family protein [Candidatus Nomurabacteria bacterium]|jgi:protein-disulfide isomerase|nr:DsbA family protein [Candidatus Nomurabacteria bacterium]